MKIAIPTVNSKICMHFGHCEEFAFINYDENEKKILSKEFITPPPHEPGLLPRWLNENGVNLILAGGMGQRAISLFNQNNIKVVCGIRSDEDIENLVISYFENRLDIGSNVCDH